MAEPSADINRSERLYPPNNNDSKDANLRKSKQKDTSHKRSGTLETRLDYAVSRIVNKNYVLASSANFSASTIRKPPSRR